MYGALQDTYSSNRVCLLMMLAPHAVDIAVTIPSLIASLCFTVVEPFDNIFIFVKSSCALVSGNTNKSLRPKEGRKE